MTTMGNPTPKFLGKGMEVGVGSKKDKIRKNEGMRERDRKTERMENGGKVKIGRRE